MYLKLTENIVTEIIPDTDPIFPNVPIEERFPPEYVLELIHADDGAEIYCGMEYNSETGKFAFPEPSPSEIIPVEELVEDTAGVSQAEINLDVEYRLSCLELGIN